VSFRGPASAKTLTLIVFGKEHKPVSVFEYVCVCNIGLRKCIISNKIRRPKLIKAHYARLWIHYKEQLLTSTLWIFCSVYYRNKQNRMSRSFILNKERESQQKPAICDRVNVVVALGRALVYILDIFSPAAGLPRISIYTVNI